MRLQSSQEQRRRCHSQQDFTAVWLVVRHLARVYHRNSITGRVIVVSQFEVGGLPSLVRRAAGSRSASREGWFLSHYLQDCRSGTTPALRATPPDSGGELHFPTRETCLLMRCEGINSSQPLRFEEGRPIKMNLKMAFATGIGLCSWRDLPWAQSPMPSYDKLPDWSGAWSMMGGTVFDRASQTGQGGALAVGVREHPPYNAEWEAKYQKNVALKDQGPVSRRHYQLRRACGISANVQPSGPVRVCRTSGGNLDSRRERSQRDAHLHGRAKASR